MSSTRGEAGSSRGWVALIVASVVAALLAAVIVLPIFLVLMFFTTAKPEGVACTPGGGTSVINEGTQAPYKGGWMNPGVGPRTSAFGPRIHPVTGVHTNHSGQDIAAPDNSEIHAAGSGTVTIAGKSSGGNTGFMVAIDHGGGIQSRYVHMWPDEIKVKVGQKVTVGDVVGLVGASGQATGPHLHFEIRINGKPTEPIAWMKTKGVELGVSPNTPPAKDGEEASQAPATAEAVPAADQAARANALAGPAGGVTDAKGATYKSSDGENFTPGPQEWQNIQRVLQYVDKSGKGKKAAVITIMTVLVESRAKIYANSTVPESMGYPHQKVGSDHDSVGLFQQRPSQGWGPVKDLMTVDYSTEQFLKALSQVKGWKEMPLGDAAQAVQRSGVPDAYAKWESAATAIVNGQGANFTETAAGAGCGPTIKDPVPAQLASAHPELLTQQPSPSTAATKDAADPSGTPPASDEASATSNSEQPTTAPPPANPDETRTKIEAALNSKIGRPYLTGGRDPQGWDGNGLVWWATDQAGLKGIPYIDAWTAGREIDPPRTGDLVVCGARPDGTWRTTGIHTAENNNTFYTVLPGQGTRKTPIPGSCKYYSLVD